MHEEINKPIFVVGSPRSGTSILAWCLGHHPNIFPVPESNWMGDFAANVAVAHQVGSARDGLSILSAMDIRDDEFFAAFGQSINKLVVGHRRHLEINRENTDGSSKLNPRWVEATRMAAGPKTRWVDGTPEYSLHICGLRKLFPQARFVHAFREVDAVVCSMVHFHRATGIHLVENEGDAYKYWLRTVRACFKAEEAYGPNVIYRLRYSALVENPESALRALLDFLGEPYSAKCLEPLSERINSSNVPADFASKDPATDPVIIEQAMSLSRDLQHSSQPPEGSPAATAEMETAFDERVHYMATVDSQYRRALQAMQKLERAAASESDILSNVPNSSGKSIDST